MPRRQNHAQSLSLLALLLTSSLTVAQNTHSPATISKTTTNLLVSWTGIGTLQSSPTISAAWQDILEASSPRAIAPTNAQQFFRVISRWSTLANLIEANSEMGVAELNGKIYVLGGQTDTGSAYVNNVQEFNPATSNWTYRATMPTGRSAGAAAVIGDRIYVAGGRPPRGNDFAVYNATSNTWQNLPNLPTQRNHIAACAIDGKIYFVGGRLQAGFTSAMTNILEVFDPATTNWTTRAPMPTTRGGINGIAANGCFFVFGGEGPNGVFDEMEMYVPAQDRWYALEPLPIAVHGVTGSAYVNGWIHLPGGGTSTGGSSGATLHQVFWVNGINP